MRVLMLASGDLWAGAEVMVYQLVSGFASATDVKLCIVLLNNARLAEELKRKGIEVHVIDESKHSFLSSVRAVKKIIAIFSPDVIHSHRYKENILALLAGPILSKIRLVSTQHGMPELVREDQDSFPFAKLRAGIFFRLLAHFFDRTVLVSEEMRRSLVGSYGFTKKKIRVIHNGIRIPEKINDHSREKITIGSAGRFSPVKDFSLFVDIAKLVVAQNDTVDFVLAGDGPERLMLEEKVRENDLQGRFKFLGHQDDMDSFYKNIDIYLNTSMHEGIPMSVLEAMSHGLPVIVPKVGGFPEIVIEGTCGYLVDERNPSIFADRCIELLSNQQKRQQMAAVARQRVIDYFSRKAMASEYHQLYQELLLD